MPPIDDPLFTSTALTFAGDAAYDADGDAYDGSVVKVEPSAGQLAQGLRPGRQLPAQHQNWILSQFAGILSLLRDNDDEHEGVLAAHTEELALHQDSIDLIISWINNSSPRVHVEEFLVDGTWTVPPRCVAAFAFGCGGGGAGGGGENGAHVDARYMAGGAGGGGAIASLVPLGKPSVPLLPGTVLNVDIGAGGVPYLAGLGGTGGDGGDTTVRYGVGILARFMGAQGGRGAVGGQSTVDVTHYTMGGMAVRDTPIMLIGPSGQGIRYSNNPLDYYATFASTIFGGASSLYIPMQTAQGGFGNNGISGKTSGAGSRNTFGGYAGGAAGIKGSDGTIDAGVVMGTNLTRRGGGGGGGGGAGPFGSGGNGGAGQHGDPDGGSVAWTDGGWPGYNTGAGGGGGGSGGWCNDDENVGGNNSDFGGSGGSGRCFIIWVQESF